MVQISPLITIENVNELQNIKYVSFYKWIKHEDWWKWGCEGASKSFNSHLLCKWFCIKLLKISCLIWPIYPILYCHSVNLLVGPTIFDVGPTRYLGRIWQSRGVQVLSSRCQVLNCQTCIYILWIHLEQYVYLW